MLEFTQLKLLTQAWVLAMIAGYNKENRIKAIMKAYVGVFPDFEFCTTPIDTMFTCLINNTRWYCNCGTKNLLAWKSNLSAWLRNGWHHGITVDTEKLFIPAYRRSETGIQVKITGQSRGGAMSLYENFLLRSDGFSDVESFGFANPYIAGPEAREVLDLLGVRNTLIYSDPTGPLPSDPTNNVGSVLSKHWGTQLNIGGSGSLFDHGYKSSNERIVSMYLRWGWDADAKWLSRYGMLIAPK